MIDSFSNYINEFTKLDPTIPRINTFHVQMQNAHAIILIQKNGLKEIFYMFVIMMMN